MTRIYRGPLYVIRTTYEAEYIYAPLSHLQAQPEKKTEISPAVTLGDCRLKLHKKRRKQHRE